MSKIIGSTTATPVPRSDWAQTNENRADYILNKPELGALAAKDVVSKTDLASEVQASLEKADTAIQNLDGYATEDYVSTALEAKADATHDHSDVYYSKTELDAKFAQSVQIQMIKWEADD